MKNAKPGWRDKGRSKNKKKIANRVLQRRRKLNIYVEMRGEEITHSKLQKPNRCGKRNVQDY